MHLYKRYNGFIISSSSISKGYNSQQLKELLVIEMEIGAKPLSEPIMTRVSETMCHWSTVNCVNPVCRVASVCHQVRCMHWGHLGHFQRAISHLHGWPSTQPSIITHNLAAHHQTAHNPAVCWLGCVRHPYGEHSSYITFRQQYRLG